MVTHDMGSVIKYCDKVILLNKGSFVAEGKAGEIVDLYKKILANRFEIEEEAKDDKLPVEAKATDTCKLMKESLSINPNVTEYGDKRAEIYDLGLIDSKGEISNLLIKGEEFTIRERIRFFADIKQPIFTYTIKDKKGTELSGTNTMFELTDIEEVHAGDSYDVEFRQKMNLQGGEYLISMSCTGFENGQHVVYHRLYDVANITVISNKNTVGIYDMESRVSASLHRK